jgi:hypothetical protein
MPSVIVRTSRFCSAIIWLVSWISDLDRLNGMAYSPDI